MARFVLDDSVQDTKQGKRFVFEGETSQPEPVTALESFGRGVVDPISGGAQLLTHVLPSGVVEAGNNLNNWIADKTGLVATIPEGGLDQMLSEDEAKYQQRRQAGAEEGKPGVDWSRLVGNVASPANIAVASRIPVAASLAGRVASGAAGGSAVSAFAPVYGGGDYAGSKADQIGAGAALGGMLPAAIGGVSRVISPKAATNAKVAVLQAEGVKPTVGQTLGGRANVLEEKLMSWPLVGDAIANARTKSAESFNSAAINRATAPIGVKINEIGREGIAAAKKALSDAYDELTPRLTFAADTQFAGDVNKIRSMAGSSLPPGEYRQFDKFLMEKVIAKMTNSGRMSGESFKTVESELSRQAKGYLGDPSFDKRKIGEALREVLISMRANLMRSNPEQAARLAKINEGYANFARLRRAGGMLGADEGVFTPGQLQSAVRAADESVGKGQFATGKAFMQDLSEAGKSVLGNKVPNSFTTDRALIAAGGLGLGAGVSPAIPAAMAGGAGLYTAPVQNALRFLLTSRPRGAENAANTLRNSYPMLIPAGVQFGANVSD